MKAGSPVEVGLIYLQAQATFQCPNPLVIPVLLKRGSEATISSH